MGEKSEELTFSSEDARNKWRELIDAVLSGKTPIIMRYNVKVAVLVPYHQRERELEELERLRAERRPPGQQEQAENRP